MKSFYTSVVLRYVHDVATGEFANVGVVLYAPEQRFLEARFSTSCERLNGMFVKIDQVHYREMIHYMSNRFGEIAADVRSGLREPPEALSQIVTQILPRDDSSLQWAEASRGFADDPAKVLDQLYKRLVEQYIIRSGEIAPLKNKE